MDSDNSGSMQSSSSGGGDQEEEYNSVRSESIPIFLNNNPPTLSHFDNCNSKLANPDDQSSFLSQYQTHQPLPFDLLSNIDLQLEEFSQYSQQPNQNPNPNFLLNPQGSSSKGPFAISSSGMENSIQVSGSKSSTKLVARSSKKRSRASRRAPTTVLNTDTSNFRAMVQEFTGIPAPPFSTSTSSLLSRNIRFDLFGSVPSNIGPPYPLLRPSPQKLQTTSSSFQSCSNTSNINHLFQPQITDYHNPSLPYHDQSFPQNQYASHVSDDQGSNLGLTVIDQEMNMRNHIGYVNITNPHDSENGGILDSQGNTLLPAHNVSTITTSWISPSHDQ